MKKIFIFLSIMVAVIALCCGIYLNFYSYENTGDDMAPTLSDNDIVLVGFSRQFERGDIVVLKNQSNQLAIRRIIGVGGDKITIKSGKVYVQPAEEGIIFEVNDLFLSEDNIGHTCLTKSNTCATSLDAAGKSFSVSKNKFFVLGDNRNNSEDSRHWTQGGLIDKESIKGVSGYIFWPLNRAGFIEKVDILN